MMLDLMFVACTVGFFLIALAVCMGLRPAEIEGAKRMLGNMVLLGICVLTGVYLLAALLWPERF